MLRLIQWLNELDIWLCLSKFLAFILTESGLLLFGHFIAINLIFWLGCFLWVRPRETKITYLDITVLVNQDVRRFDVSMHHIDPVEEIDGAQEVVYDSDNVILLDHTLGDTGEQFLKIEAKVLLDDVDVVEL